MEKERIDVLELDRVAKWRQCFNVDLRAAFEAALSNQSDWMEIKEKWKVENVGEQEINGFRKSGLPQPIGAFPIEFKLFLDKQVHFYLKKIKEETAFPKARAVMNALLDFEMEIRAAQETELSRFVQASKPKLSVADIFNNAAPSLNQYSKNTIADKSYSIKCKTCGAARLEEEQYDNCFYCGTPLF